MKKIECYKKEVYKILEKEVGKKEAYRLMEIYKDTFQFFIDDGWRPEVAALGMLMGY